MKRLYILTILTICLLVLNTAVYSQDKNGDGMPDNIQREVPVPEFFSRSSCTSMVFNQYWESPAGMFSNVNDIVAGYFDGDTLLDVACYTFTPSVTFYVYEQVPIKPDSFAVVYQYNKTEFGAFGPMTFGDSDGDGLVEIITADYSTLTRLYIFECTGNNTYVSRETQNTLTLPSVTETARFIYITDMNKNGKKEIAIGRSTSSSPYSTTIRFWEQTGAAGSHTYNNLYTYIGIMYLFGRGGYGDSDGDGWGELFITYGSSGTYPINVSRLEYDSVSAAFVFLTTPLTKIGFPCYYAVADVNNDGEKELIMASYSGGAAVFVLKSTGANSYTVIESLLEPADNNSMLCADVKKLAEDVYPSIVSGSFNGKVYVYTSNGTNFTKQYEKTDLPSGAIRNILWTDVDRKNGFTFHNGNTARIFKRDTPLGITPGTEITGDYKLFQNYPNPFNPTTKINFALPKSGFVTLKVYDKLGRLLQTLISGNKQSGEYSVQFGGEGLSSGIYFFKLEADNFSSIRKGVLIK